MCTISYHGYAHNSKKIWPPVKYRKMLVLVVVVVVVVGMMMTGFVTMMLVVVVVLVGHEQLFLFQHSPLMQGGLGLCGRAC